MGLPALSDYSFAANYLNDCGLRDNQTECALPEGGGSAHCTAPPGPLAGKDRAASARPAATAQALLS